MRRIIRFVRKRWILSLVALILLIPAARVGWNAWRRAAIQRAVALRVNKVWIDRAGIIHAKLRFCFDPDSLPAWYRIACPDAFVYETPNGGFRPFVEYEPAFENAIHSVPGKFMGRYGTGTNEIANGYWYINDYSSGGDQVQRIADTTSQQIVMCVGLRLGGYVPWRRSKYSIERINHHITWSRRLDRLPHWLTDPFLNLLVPLPEEFFVEPQTFALDPMKRDFDFITQTPMNPIRKP